MVKQIIEKTSLIIILVSSLLGINTFSKNASFGENKQSKPLANLDELNQARSRNRPRVSFSINPALSRRLHLPFREVPAATVGKHHAREITVRVIVGNHLGSGSGILINRDHNHYQVITNRHVISSSKNTASYQIETPDGVIHSARLNNNITFPQQDLAILEFTSQKQEYAIAQLETSETLTNGQPVIAAGFPLKNRQLKSETALEINTGKISLLPAQALTQGYQIGYTNAIEKGMSGGPLLNLNGKVVGINGMHAYPIWGNPYVYENGEKPTPGLQKRMRELSWAIPIEKMKTILTELETNK